ncbi:MAG: hypothetical protein WC953_08280 [Pseudomonas sp.]
MYGLYSKHLDEKHLDAQQRKYLQQLRTGSPLSIEGASEMAGGNNRKNFATGSAWLSGFFDNGAQNIVDMYADEFVWEDMEFDLTITDKEELFKFFTVFDDAGPDSPHGVHIFNLISYDGHQVSPSHATIRTESVPEGWDEAEYKRLAGPIMIGSDFEYDEWGYMQWIWRAHHNADFFGIPAAGKTTVTRGTSTQFYRNGKIVRCRTHWNFREFAIQLGVVPRT